MAVFASSLPFYLSPKRLSARRGMMNIFKTLIISIFGFFALAGCSDEDAGKIDPKVLSMLNEGIGKYRKIITSLQNSGLSEKEARDLANEADYSLRDLSTYLAAKKLSLSKLGISDLDQLADELQDKMSQYNARFLGPCSPELFGAWSLIENVNSSFSSENWLDPTDYAQDGRREPIIPFLYFSQIIKKYPSLANECYDQQKSGEYSHKYVKIPAEVIQLAANYDISTASATDFIKMMKKHSNSGYNEPWSSDGVGYWSAFIDGKKVRSLIIADLHQQLEAINLKIKEQM